MAAKQERVGRSLAAVRVYDTTHWAQGGEESLCGRGAGVSFHLPDRNACSGGGNAQRTAMQSQPPNCLMLVLFRHPAQYFLLCESLLH